VQVAETFFPICALVQQVLGFCTHCLPIKKKLGNSLYEQLQATMLEKITALDVQQRITHPSLLLATIGSCFQKAVKAAAGILRDGESKQSFVHAMIMAHDDAVLFFLGEVPFSIMQDIKPVFLSKRPYSVLLPQLTLPDWQELKEVEVHVEVSGMAIENAVRMIVARVLKMPSSLRPSADTIIRKWAKEVPYQSLIESCHGTGVKTMKAHQAQVLLLYPFPEHDHCRTLSISNECMFS
jgi:hypothetical protein